VDGRGTTLPDISGEYLIIIAIITLFHNKINVITMYNACSSAVLVVSVCLLYIYIILLLECATHSSMNICIYVYFK